MVVELDYDHLKQTVEGYVPYFTDLEAENQQMKI